MAWSLLLAPVADGPRFLAIARAVVDDIRRGRLTPGQRLPGSRPLATQLGVHRNTVLAALAELESQGWLVTRPARGTFVAEALPERALVPTRPGLARAGFALPPPLPPPPVPEPQAQPGRRTLSLASGVPDPRLFPVDELTRAWRRALRRSARALLTYGPPEGHPALRAALAEMVRTVRGVPATADHVLVVRGSQMALDLCARVLVRPGDVVAVEALGYRPAWDALRLAGAELVPVPVDGDGLDVAALARLAARRRVRAVYLTPHHQYPTTVTLTAARRMALAAAARRHRLIVLEDDYDHEFHYDGRPVPPLAATDDGGHVVYLGTLSKVLAPGLRLGFVVAPADVIGRLAAVRAIMDRQGDRAMEAAVAELIDDGLLQRHIRRTRLAYLARRDALVAALERRLGDVLEVTTPRGGISLWAPLRPQVRVDVDRWLAPRRPPACWSRPAGATPSTGANRGPCAWCSRRTRRPSSRPRSRCWRGRCRRAGVDDDAGRTWARPGVDQLP